MGMREAAVAVAVAAALATGGCGAPEAQERIEHDGSSRVEVLTDTETGVQYLAWSHGGAGGVTPLMDQWGFPLLAEGHERGHVSVGPSRDVGE